MSEAAEIDATVEVLGHAWLWLRNDTNIIEAQRRYVVVGCGYRHLVLHRVERVKFANGTFGDINYVPVGILELPEGEI